MEEEEAISKEEVRLVMTKLKLGKAGVIAGIPKYGSEGGEVRGLDGRLLGSEWSLDGIDGRRGWLCLLGRNGTGRRWGTIGG